MTQNSAPVVAVSTSARALEAAQPCTGSFALHTLDHTTMPSAMPAELYESNGAGVAINDLDGDGKLDIVLANLHGPNTILWNQGSLRFRTEQLGAGESRAVNIVDVDGDGHQDIVFTRRFAKPSFWHNAGDARFVEGELPDVNNPFYSMDWGDLNGDGALDLAAGSYDTELQKQQGPVFGTRGGVGVIVYLRQGEHFNAQRLAEQADALAIALPDLNADGRPDILVGNDFNRPDYTWLNGGEGVWSAVQPFAKTSENTMSLDMGDVDNDGRPEIFAADMKPYRKDTQTMAEWLPMMQHMTHPSFSGDPQITENVLQSRGADGRFVNQGYQRMIDATGWSWSSKFGDLDNDGRLDLYVVNGMIAKGLFDHLPGAELVEENRALRNTEHGDFALAPEWGLGSTASGRGMSMADLDDDGDLDIVINNLQSPAQLFENRICGGSSLEVELRQPAVANRFGIGARLALHTGDGVYYRDIRAASGYLSGDPARVHFGLPAGSAPQRLEVFWPDGALSTVDNLALHTLATVTREP